MPSRRELISMDDTQMWAFIEQQRSVQCATLDPQGWPHLTTLWFAVQDGAVLLESFSKAQKVRNLRRDNRISLLWEDGERYSELRGVVFQGRAELIDGGGGERAFEDVVRYHVAVLERNNDEGLDRAMIEQVVRSMAAKKTTVLVRPERVYSWDHGKLAGGY